MGILLSLAIASILAGMLLAVNEPHRKFKKRNKFK
jgi:hypothetical protein